MAICESDMLVMQCPVHMNNKVELLNTIYQHFTVSLKDNKWKGRWVGGCGLGGCIHMHACAGNCMIISLVRTETKHSLKSIDKESENLTQ